MTKKVIVDWGHGLNTAGKRTPVFTDGTKSPLTGKNFMHEWEFNHATGKYLIEELKRCGFTVMTVADSDPTIDTPINTRTKRANDAKADLFLSIHANAFTGQWGIAKGVETLTHNSGEGLRIGKLIQAELVQATGLTNRGMKDGSKNSVRPIGVIVYTTMPAVLVECGFMDNLAEAKLLLSDDYRKKCAVAIAKGICAGFKVSYVPASVPKPPVTPPKEVPTVSNPGVFKDVSKGHQNHAAIEHLKSIGVFNGYPDGTFKPTEPITRAQMAEVLSRAIKRNEI